MNFNTVYALPIIAAIAGLGYNQLRSPIAAAPIAATAPQQTNIPLKDKTLKLSDKRGEYTYALAATRTTLSVTETSAVPSGRFDRGGKVAQLAFFDKEATLKFEKKYKNSKQCPAGFFNRYNKWKALYATSPQVQAELKNWDNPTWKNSDGWYKTALVGRCVIGAESYIWKGEDLAPQIPSRTYEKCSHFYVERIVHRKPYLTKI